MLKTSLFRNSKWLHPFPFSFVVFIIFTKVMAKHNDVKMNFQKKDVSMATVESSKETDELDQQMGRKILEVVKDANVLLIGEFHGTAETPRLLSKLIQLNTHHKRFKVFLEIRAANYAAYQAFKASDDDRFLKSMAHFAAEYQDGRGSIAMVELLKSLAKKKNVEVVFFDPDFDNGADDRDQKMADHVGRHLAVDSQTQNIILTGNIHASQKIGHPYDLKFKSMAHLLKNRINKGAKMLSVNVLPTEGKFWACFNDLSKECGEKVVTKKDDFQEKMTDKNLLIEEQDVAESGYNYRLLYKGSKASVPYVQH